MTAVRQPSFAIGVRAEAGRPAGAVAVEAEEVRCRIEQLRRRGAVDERDVRPPSREFLESKPLVPPQRADQDAHADLSTSRRASASAEPVVVSEQPKTRRIGWPAIETPLDPVRQRGPARLPPRSISASSVPASVSRAYRGITRPCSPRARRSRSRSDAIATGWGCAGCAPRPRPPPTAMSPGSLPTGIVATTELVAGSIRETVPSIEFATQTAPLPVAMLLAPRPTRIEPAIRFGRGVDARRPCRRAGTSPRPLPRRRRSPPGTNGSGILATTPVRGRVERARARARVRRPRPRSTPRRTRSRRTTRTRR